MTKALTRFLLAIPIVYLFLFFVAPSLWMLVISFAYPGEYGGIEPFWQQGRHLHLTGESYLRFFSVSVYIRLFWRSTYYALIATFFCVLMALPLVFWLIRLKKRQGLFLFLVILPFWSNFLVRIYSWMILLGPQGFLAKMTGLIAQPLGFFVPSLLYTPAAVIIGLVYIYLPFMVLPLYANLKRFDFALLDAARDLGANRLARFRRIILPQAIPGLLSGSILVFVPALGAFAIPELLGGTKAMMIGNVISHEFLSARDWPFGATLSILLTVFALCLAFCANRIFKERHV